MTDFASLLQQGNAWLFIPSAILLGALHGLEPGHSKTMMAAFIVAVRGTLKQAVLLGLAATYGGGLAGGHGRPVVWPRLECANVGTLVSTVLRDPYRTDCLLDAVAYLARISFTSP